MPFKEAFHTLYALAIAALAFGFGWEFAVNHHLIGGLGLIAIGALVFAGWIYTAPWKIWVTEPLIVVLLIAAVFYLRLKIADEDTYLLSQPSGDLLPPPGSPRPSPGAPVQVILGTDTFLLSRFPQPIILLDGKPIMVISKIDCGISVSLFIRDLDAGIVLQLLSNHIDINQNNVFRFERKDFSSLRILDKFGNEIVNIHLDDLTTLSVSGLIIYSSDSVVVNRLGIWRRTFEETFTTRKNTPLQFRSSDLKKQLGLQ